MRRLLLLLTFLAGCRTQIHHGLDERDANEIISVLTSRGFEAQKVSEKGKKPTWAIEVDDERAAEALRVLAEMKLPRPQRTTTRDVAAQSGLIDTPSAEKLRQFEALEGDIEQTLETMDGVVSAGVEIVVPAVARPGQPTQPSKASALLRVQPDSYERISQQREQLKMLIAGSVEGLKSDDVALVIDRVEFRTVAPVVEDNGPRLKLMILVLSVLLTAIVGILAVLTLHLRKVSARAKVARTPTPKATPAPSGSKPVISSGARKVA
jgi:type III secretion protein J